MWPSLHFKILPHPAFPWSLPYTLCLGCAEYVVGAQEMRWTAKMNGDIKYLACPTQCLKHNRNSITKIATLALLIKINLLIFPSPGCVLVGWGP